ncbi:MAG: hypothetical protein SFZ23_02325 [Planctomycetota bacterium]|nr:hypothetical protein [Planctomycetota bacterium]
MTTSRFPGIEDLSDESLAALLRAASEARAFAEGTADVDGNAGSAFAQSTNTDAGTDKHVIRSISSSRVAGRRRVWPARSSRAGSQSQAGGDFSQSRRPWLLAASIALVFAAVGGGVLWTPEERGPRVANRDRGEGQLTPTRPGETDRASDRRADRLADLGPQRDATGSNAGGLPDAFGGVVVAVFRDACGDTHCVFKRENSELDGRAAAWLSDGELLQVALNEQCVPEADRVVVFGLSGPQSSLPQTLEEAKSLAACLFPTAESSYDAPNCVPSGVRLASASLSLSPGMPRR